MRVLFAIDTLNSGGAQRQAVELAVRLVHRGDVQARFAVYHADDFFRPRLDAAGIEVTVLPKARRYEPGFPRTVRRDLAARPADVVHAFLLPPSLWSVLALRPLPRDLRPALIAAERNEQIGTSLPELLLQRFTYRRADAVTVNAQPVAREIERRLRVPADRIHYIPNGIDLEAWDRASQRACPLPLEPGLFHVGVVGRVAPQKNHELLLDALGRIPPETACSWRVWVIGRDATDSPEGLRLQALARSRGLDAVVRFVPPERDIAAVMARLSAVALPSRHEGFPNVVLEGMAAGLPVVATAVGDVPQMLEHGISGLMVPNEDAAAFAGALLRVHALGAAGRSDMGKRARARVERQFSMDAIADRYLELYRQLIAGRASYRAS
jgi:glycosyltransferase involved in cell wall biosynthesis